MKRVLFCAVLGIALTLPSAYASWSSTTYNLDAQSLVGMAPSLTAPINSFANGGSDTDSQTGMTTPLPGPLGTDLLETGVILTPGLVGQDRRSQASASASGSPLLNDTLTLISNAGTLLQNNNFFGTMKTTATATSQFIGEFESSGSKALIFTVDGLFGYRANHQNGAPVVEPQRAEMDLNLSLLVENVTKGQTMASTDLFSSNLVQAVFGFNNSFNNPFNTGAFVPLFTTSPGDTIRVTITAATFADGAVQEFGNSQIGATMAGAFFEEVNIRFTGIPEPGTAALLLTGLFGVGFLRRRVRTAVDCCGD